MRAKYKPGKFVDLNTADTTELMKIPGIGPVRARRIVEYRHALGGYHTIRQVHESYDLPEELGDWVHISTPKVKKLSINKVTLSQLRAHPYLTFYQARAIIELRKREGTIRSVRQLLFLDEFSEADISRLEPYLSFE
jgi:DNA uptake protein ComE-like DNA-binding protein